MQPTQIGLLQPIAPANQNQPPQPINNTTNKPSTKLGATWADTKGAINIDVDNLLAPKSPKATPAPSINQLKSSPNSPAHGQNSNIMGGFQYMQSVNNNFMQNSGQNLIGSGQNLMGSGQNLIGSGQNLMGSGQTNNNIVRQPFVNQNSFLQ
ncbi:hypothetical protein K1T71_013442 [Dendrolimus kikuchii]|uniref:Uncharacterized protein n=1 Tax=Dendrolimus kikuchii TaxID=765133 RepID=A0ACC1CGG0_9NEOP|nr:hypothetical protein K1T71_013442 [Dendrolimus kikuchii]